MSEVNAWYVVRRPDDSCAIVTAVDIGRLEAASEQDIPERWGPFASEAEAIARRVGLIRSGKCQPT
jgi:hypothetical protein